MISKAQFDQIDTFVSKFAAQVPLGSYAKTKGSAGVIGDFLRNFRALGISQYPRLTRSRTFKYLLSLTFHLNMKKGKLSAFADQTYQNLRIVFMVKVLLMIGARGIAIKLATNGLLVAKRLELTENIVAFLIELRRNAALTGKKTQHANLTKQLRYYTKLQSAEQQAQYYVERLTIHFSRSLSPKPHIAKQGHRSADIIEQRTATVVSGELKLSHFRIRALSYQIEHSFGEARNTCNQALDYVRSNKASINPLREGEFILKQLVCAMMEGQHHEALGLVKQAEIFFEKSIANWVLLKEYHLLTLLQMERWSEANEVLQSTLTSPRMSATQASIIERWNVYSLFLQFIEDPFAPNARLSKLHNDQIFTRVAPSFARDKAGLYFSLLLLKIMLLLTMRRFAEAIDPIDALVSYRKRYLTGEGNQSAAKLGVVLKNIADANFSQKNLDEGTNKLIAELTQGATGPNVFTGIQVIPYSTVIGVILKAAP